MSVAGVIVTHGPDPELPRAVAALGPQVDELVVVANPPAPETDAQLIVNERRAWLRGEREQGRRGYERAVRRRREPGHGTAP